MKHFAGLAFLKPWAIASLFLITFFSSAQNIAVGTWRTHFSYSDARIIEQTPDIIFCVSQNGFFSIDKEDNSIRKLSKIDGLSDIGISAMKYDSENKVLILGYRSGLVDLIFEDRIETIRDIFNSNLEGDKTINDITSDESRLYLATGLGIIVINTLRSEVVENYVQIGEGGSEVEVLEINQQDNQLMIRTEEGMQSGSLNTNLLDFNNWNHYSSTESLTNLVYGDESYFALESVNLFQFSSSEWIDTGIDLPSEASKIFRTVNTIHTVGNGIIYRLTGSTFESLTSTIATSVNDLGFFMGEFWMADGEIGLVTQSGNTLSPDGPVSDTFSRVKVIQNEVYGFHAPSPFTYGGSEKMTGYSFFSEGEWSIKEITDFQNVSDVAKFNGNVYFSSIGDGLYDQLNDEVITQIPDSHPDLDTVITALSASDKLWISSFGNLNPIHHLTIGDVWTSFSSTELADNRFTSIDLTLTGNAWLGGSSGAITVIDEGQNQTSIISTADGLPASFTDIDLSVEDDAWIATSKGPALFTNASFLGNAQAITPSFENRILFEDETINAVMTDGGNRIWFGTNRGLWIFDENTSEQVALFNESNSPIPSNKILDLVYNPANGEVFIYTDKGLVSYRSSSSIGDRTHQNVTIFPNPVRPNFSGLVGIKGVAKNVSIKITDINGNLVKEINANGGTASWDLLDVSNKRVVTGVYFIFSSSSDGIETYVGKVAVIR